MDEIGFPMAKLSSPRHGVRAEQDTEFRGKPGGPPTPIAPALAPTRGEVPPELCRTAVLGIDRLVNCLLADAASSRVGAKHLGAYFDKRDPLLERVAILRTRLDMTC